MKIFISIFLLFCLSNASSLQYEKTKNIVIDTRENIMWQDNTDVINFLETFTSGKVYCDILVLNGYIDWRKPTIKELQSIVDVHRKNSINKNFKYVEKKIYLTNTTFKNDVNKVWAIDFKNGKTLLVKKDEKNFLRCVRDIK